MPSLSHRHQCRQLAQFFRLSRTATHLRHVLQLYEVCSGQMINKEKSSILFSKNTNVQDRKKFMDVLAGSNKCQIFGATGLYGEVKSQSVHLFERKDMETTSGLEGKVVV